MSVTPGDRNLAEQMMGVAELLARGTISREQAINSMMVMAAQHSDTVHRDTTLKSQGRISFGRQREGEQGQAIWVPASVLDEGTPEEFGEDG